MVMDITSSSAPTSRADAPPAPAFAPAQLREAALRVRETAYIVREPSGGRIGVSFDVRHLDATGGYEHLATLPPMYPEWLGDRAFCETHGLRFPYVGGAMANGITSPEMVIRLAHAGMLGFLGTAGLSLERMIDYIDRTAAALHPQRLPFGANLIHSPQEPGLEMATVELFLSRGVRRVSASAFMRLTPAVVRYAVSGLFRDAHGRVQRSNFLFAKISRPEVAEPFLKPAPQKMLEQLVSERKITAEEAALAREVPVASDITVESDSGGHTDRRPLGPLFSVIARLRDDLQRAHGFTTPVRLGAAGGLGTPQAVAAAFGLGAAFVLTGSINQASVEANQSPTVKAMLAQARFADVTMCPAGDMFEMGVEVQVLKRGNFFAARAKRLFEVYSTYPSIEAIEPEVREKLEREIFQQPMEEVWQKTREFFTRRDPQEIERAERDPRHRLALVCRWYLGLSSRWAIEGVEGRQLDYQVWMGPAQGAFNDWARGTFLEPLEARHVDQMALNLMEGAARHTRASQLRAFGAAIPPDAFDHRPLPLA
ncbi:PfaD family polyunsaturated fatty acid/polyketide biosynthesis protein [Bradymonadaceae bacterium TMQ3]|nr:PfaD family polyunsaturated fatty acid/polyketide biosynthesis protein [Bradymonadaceae bacterium TMQ3]TXC74892.1 PfaD family polyunsaturated fatty acid/polyketide biosynthesis protein [Bradymonadales bacterium TMQ1]